MDEEEEDFTRSARRDGGHGGEKKRVHGLHGLTRRKRKKKSSHEGTKKKNAHKDTKTQRPWKKDGNKFRKMIQEEEERGRNQTKTQRH